MNTPLHEEEKSLPEIKNTTAQTPKKKWYHRFLEIPKGIIITILISFVIIIGIVLSYEHKLGKKERYYYGYDNPQIYRYRIDPWDDFGWFDDRWDDQWRAFDQRMEMMERRHRAMIDSFEVISDTSLEGKYSGTRIVNGDTLTYALDIGSDTVSGNYSGTESSTLDTIKKSLESLGYTITKQENGYSFSGTSENTKQLIELFR